MAEYTGKIRIFGNPTAVSFSVEAGNGAEAKRIVNNLYQVKQWLKQPTRY